MEEHRKEEVSANQDIGMVKGILTQLGNQKKEGKKDIGVADLGEPTHTLVPCWTPKPLPPRN